MKFLLLILCFSVPLYVAYALSSDGLTLVSLLNHWTFVPPSINSSWKASDSTPCSWVGVQCDHDSNVVSLNLTASGINGKLGPEIGNLNHLQTLVLLTNNLSGIIPLELGNCGALEYLDISDNSFSGKIPYTLKKLQSLKHILLHNNRLSGELPLELTELQNLRNVSLFDNHLSGVIPQSLGINSSLVKLDLMNNKFTGNIPTNICSGKQLRTLNLGLNQLQGGIPHDVGSCATLRTLILKGNNLNGSIPDFESNQNLKYMDMSNNNIDGAIPSSLGKFTNLIEINLSMNKLTGVIPSELGNLVNLWILNLSHNKLEGPLPPQLSNCSKMDYFDVAFNRLNGSFPSSLRNWTRITTLILRENRFTGGIPVFLSEFSKLLELQLGGNLFGGEIPRSLGALQNLFYGLNLSANGLTGEVPSEIGKLKKLLSLDVSVNNLTGSVYVLNELSSLIEVNISYNSFVGPVPERLMQYLNSSMPPFLGNPGLCVDCSLSEALSCTEFKTFYNLKPCDHHKSTDKNGLSIGKIVMIELGSSIFLYLVLPGLVCMYLKHRSKQKEKEKEAQFSTTIDRVVHGMFGDEPSSSLVKEVMKATENLNDRHIIGRGAHGVVYKAPIDPPSHHIVAVKKVVFTRNKRRSLSMLREIETIRKIKHRNLVRFEGFWIGKDYGLIFYPYMVNGSLHDVLHERNPLPTLEWNIRYKIAVGIAHGLAYLHHDCNPPIVHQDIKPKNILLDPEMEPHISDFGVAMLLDQSSSSPSQKRSTYIALGTVGYIAPENAYTIVQSGVSDVYSYGVVLLELITRKKVLDPSFLEKITLVGWARSVWMHTRNIENIVDSSLARELSDRDVVEQVIRVLCIALQCSEKDPRRRPTMRKYENGRSMKDMD